MSKVQHLRMFIAAGKAAPAPPLGTAIGPRGLNIMQICHEFNEKTKHIKPGVPIPTVISYKADRTYTMEIGIPPVSYFLRRMAGMAKGRSTPHKASADAALIPGQVVEPVHRLGLKHIYEIAKLKQEGTPSLKNLPLESVCRMVLGAARSAGIEIVKHWDNIPTPVDTVKVIS